MAAKAQERAGFPSRMARWCTQELKVFPLQEYRKQIERLGFETVTITGIRHEEGTASNKRGSMLELEDDEQWGGWMWRPILKWTIADVIGIHHRHNIPVNPLYQRGHSRVGCYPCIMSTKQDIRLVAQYSPERINTIRELELAATQERHNRNQAKPGRYKHPNATFFMTVERNNSESNGTYTIDKIVEWAQTERGGKQLPLIQSAPDGGCFKWGICDAPHADADDEPNT